MPKNKTLKADPEQIARDAVREHLEQMTGDIDSVLDDGSDVRGKIPLDVLTRIEDALIAAHVAQGGNEPEADGEFELFALQAGYLLGVQVGRRLGSGGQ